MSGHIYYGITEEGYDQISMLFYSEEDAKRYVAQECPDNPDITKYELKGTSLVKCEDYAQTT